MPVSRETHSALLPLSPDVASGMVALAQWLREAAFPLGLTNYPDADTMLAEAVLPAVALPSAFGRPLSGHWVDLGAGSGAIGLAAAILSPAASVTLVDRRRRAASFLDLTAKRLSLPNVSVLEAAFTADSGPNGFTGVCFRALTAPTHALRIAAAHARRWICAWHAPGLAPYDTPPANFRPVARVPTSTPALLLDIYERTPTSNPVHNLVDSVGKPQSERPTP